MTTLILPDMSGRFDQNPRDIGLMRLLAEDLRTHGGDPTEPGFMAIAMHRLGNARMRLPWVLRKPASAVWWAGWRWVTLTAGIELPYAMRIGRRVRIWHHGGIVLGALSIGDDVQIRQNTTMGVARMEDDNTARPIIGDRVDIGAGAIILGPVVVSDDAVIGAGAVVTKHVPARATVVGIPAMEMA